jgi:DNA polymerase (family 10)
MPALLHVGYAGSIRRACPTVGDLDLVAAAQEPAAALDAFAGLPHIATIETRTERRIDARLHNGKGCSLFVADPDAWGAALAMWTGSGAHRERLRQLAAELGMTLDENGLSRGSLRVPTPTEADLYRALGLSYIEPELREDWGEIEAARDGKLPELVRVEDIRGDLHTHTEWSDAAGTIMQMAEGAIARGYRYYAITDHGAYMGMVNGLDAARLKAQRAEIDAANGEFARRGLDFRLLQGTEVDILPDGSLALADDVLATLDWVVASLHVSLRQDRETVTRRLINAIRNPHVDSIGHPTGRILLRRDGADLDMDAVLAAAAETGVVLEVDGSYPRLDLDAEFVKQALERGIKLCIDSDAHHLSELAMVDYGVLTARRGWATRAEVVNTWSWEEIEAYKKGRGGQG